LSENSHMQRSIRKASSGFTHAQQGRRRVALDRLIAKLVFEQFTNRFTDFQQTEESCPKRETSQRYSQAFLRLYLADPPCPKLAELHLRSAATKWDADALSKLKITWIRFLEATTAPVQSNMRAMRLRDLLDERLHNRFSMTSGNLNAYRPAKRSRSSGSAAGAVPKRARKDARALVSKVSANSERAALVRSFAKWLTPKMKSEKTVPLYSRYLREFLSKRTSPETMAEKQIANVSNLNPSQQATLSHFSRFWASKPHVRRQWQQYVKLHQELLQQFQQYLEDIASLNDNTRHCYLVCIRDFLGLPSKQAIVCTDICSRSILDPECTKKIAGLSNSQRAALSHFRAFCGS